MRLVKVSWLLAAIGTVAVACAPAAIRAVSGPALPGEGPSITASVSVPQGFATKAAPATIGQVAYYTFQLYDLGMSTVASTFTTVAQTCRFTTVPDGTYQLRAEAFNGSSVSITQGGQKVSANTATVASPNVNYSTGTSLSVALPLLNGTGETIANTVTVTNGLTYTGPAAGAP